MTIIYLFLYHQNIFNQTELFVNSFLITAFIIIIDYIIIIDNPPIFPQCDEKCHNKMEHFIDENNEYDYFKKNDDDESELTKDSYDDYFDDY
jgi:hypothetical protein